VFLERWVSVTQQASFLLTCFTFRFYSRAADLSPTRPTAARNLAHQVYQPERALTLARASRPSASGPIPLRTRTCVCPSNHISFLTPTNSLPYEFLCGIATLPLGVYVVPQDPTVPPIVLSQLFSFFSLHYWAQYLCYGPAARSHT